MACQTDVQKPSTSGESSFIKSDSHMKKTSYTAAETETERNTKQSGIARSTTSLPGFSMSMVDQLLLTMAVVTTIISLDF